MYYSEQDISIIEEAENFNDLPKSISGNEVLESLENQSIPNHIKDFVGTEELKHREFLQGAFWKRIPAFHDVSVEEFLDIKFQNKHTVRKVSKLEELTKGLVDTKFIEEVKAGMQRAPMNLSISPYIMSLIDWNDPWNDPLRIQFIPVENGFK
ncbi:MAG: hypothetical protein MJA30_16900, partial [Cytophagales bacterium]|nr:hypothetical protein [Cytophagales bacterium]